MPQLKKYSVYRILGIILVMFSIIGFITIADEMRHIGEFIGVCSVMTAGFILLLKDSNIDIFGKYAIQWISYCLLLSIPLGGVLLDNMPLGTAIGCITGAGLSFLFRIKNGIVQNK